MKHAAITLSAVMALLIVSVAGLTQSAPQSRPPGTDIFVAAMSERRGKLSFGKPTNITKRQGYDNQPYFLTDGRGLLFTSIREDNQADIYRYDLEKGAATRVTETTESEYSATPTPDAKHISVIRVEADSTQRLWKFPLAGGMPSLVLERIKPVGYHAWVDEKRVILFILGTPNTLQLVDVPAEKAEVIASNVGRALAKVPKKQNMSFVHKLSDSEWVIKELDIKSQKAIPVTKTLTGSEDYAWTPQGDLLMAKGAKLFKFTPNKDNDWQEVADFSSEGIAMITRLAVSPKGNRVAFVASEN